MDTALQAPTKAPNVPRTAILENNMRTVQALYFPGSEFEGRYYEERSHIPAHYTCKLYEPRPQPWRITLVEASVTLSVSPDMRAKVLTNNLTEEARQKIIQILKAY